MMGAPSASSTTTADAGARRERDPSGRDPVPAPTPGGQPDPTPKTTASPGEPASLPVTHLPPPRSAAHWRPARPGPACGPSSRGSLKQGR